MRYGFLFLLAAASLAAQPRITAAGNGADFSAAIAPGSLASIFGTGLAAATASAPAVPFPAALGGVSVSVAGRPARITFVSPTQVNFQVPYGVPTGAAAVTLTNAGAASNTVQVPVTATAPGIFQYGANRGVVQNQDFSLNGSANPAEAASVIIVYLTGIGLTNPAVADGATAPAGPLAVPTASAAATIGGASAPVLFIGLTPGNVGLAQANLQVPALATGDHPLVVTLNGVASRPVQVAVKGSAPSTGGGPSNTGPPPGLDCLSGPVESVVFSLQLQPPGLAGEITIGGTRLCEKCDRKPPVFAEFVNLLEAAREDGLTADACYDNTGRVNLVQLRR